MANGITLHDNGTITLEGDAVELYALLTIRRGLKLQAETGMKLSRFSTLQAARDRGLTTKRTAAAAYREVDALLVEALGIESAGPLKVKTG